MELQTNDINNENTMNENLNTIHIFNNEITWRYRFYFFYFNKFSRISLNHFQAKQISKSSPVLLLHTALNNKWSFKENSSV